MALTLRQWRRLKEITQAQMADKLNVHVNTYQNWEERPEKISIEYAQKNTSILNISIDDISFTNEKGD